MAPRARQIAKPSVNTRSSCLVLPSSCIEHIYDSHAAKVKRVSFPPLSGSGRRWVAVPHKTDPHSPIDAFQISSEQLQFLWFKSGPTDKALDVYKEYARVTRRDPNGEFWAPNLKDETLLKYYGSKSNDIILLIDKQEAEKTVRKWNEDEQERKSRAQSARDKPKRRVVAPQITTRRSTRISKGKKRQALARRRIESS